MRKRFRLFRRGQVFGVQNNETGKQESLSTKDRVTAERLLHAKNEAHQQPVINLQIARAYLMVSDPNAATRSWQFVMDESVKLKHGETQRRWRVAIKDKAFDSIRKLPLLETRAERLLRAMEAGKISTNIFLRRLHNFALAMNWLPVPIIPRRTVQKLERGEFMRLLESSSGGDRRVSAGIECSRSLEILRIPVE